MKLNKNPKILNLTKKFQGFDAHKALFITAMLLFSIPVLVEVIWDASVLKKLDPTDVYRLAIFLFMITSMLNFIVIERYKTWFHEIMHIANQQEEQLHIMKKLLEAKNSGSLVDLMDALDKKKKDKDDDEELKN